MSAGSRRRVALADRILARFADPAGGFFDTADDHERLVTRPKDVQDNAVPSGNAMATSVLLRLAALDGGGSLPRRRGAGDADGHRRSWRGIRRGSRSGSSAMDLALATGVEVAIVGDAGRSGDARRCSTVADRRVPAEPGRRGQRRTQRRARSRCCSTGSRSASRHRLRLPRLRVPPAGDGCRGAASGAGRATR